MTLNLEEEIFTRWKANQGIVYLSGDEPNRYVSSVMQAAERLNTERQIRDDDPQPVEVWCHDILCGWYRGLPGLSRPKNGSNQTSVALMQAMSTNQQIAATSVDMMPPFNTEHDLILIMHDVHTHIEKDPTVVQQLRNIISANLCSDGYAETEGLDNETRGKRMIVLVTPKRQLNAVLPEIKPMIMPLPTLEEMTYMVTEQFMLLAGDYEYDPTSGCPLPSKDDIRLIATTSLGLTLKAAENALAKGFVTHTKLKKNKRVLSTKDLIEDIEAEKALIIQQVQGLKYYSKKDMPQKVLPGYEPLAEFIEKRRRITPEMAAKHGGVRPLRGYSIAGPPGTGKTVVALQTAMLTDRILLILDLGRTQSKFVGSSEEQMDEALRMAEAMQAVLCLDDVDKAGASNAAKGGDSTGVMGRMIQQLLTLMTAANNNIFFVFTMNRVGGVPPELIRPGRMDRLFYAAMPEPPTRKAIMQYHLDRMKMKIDDPSILDKIASDEMTRRWSGAELNHVLIEDCAMDAMSEGSDIITSDMLIKAVQQHRPFAEMNAEIQADIQQMEKDCQQFVHVGNIPDAAPLPTTNNSTKPSTSRRTRRIEH